MTARAGLSPFGFAAAGDDLARFARRLDLGGHDVDDALVHFATELVRWQPDLGDDDRRAMTVLLVTSMVSARQGSTRLPLEGTYAKELAATISPDAPRLLDRALRLIGDPRAAGLVGGPDDYRPLIVADDHLYHHKMLAAESRLIARLRERIAAPPPDVGHAVLEAALAAARTDSVIKLSAEQMGAVRAAVTQRLCVISGGPGTGKTAIIVSILRALARLGTDVESIALAAPTGKAAQRMRSSISSSLSRIAQPELFDRALLESCPAPQTLHRLLGYSPGADRFRHHENNRLSQSVVIVDEGSMIDLVMMERLLRSVRDDAQLILLGDADQLPSVEAGAVLRDLVPKSGAPYAVRLTRSYRMDPSNPEGRAILTLAGHINAGRAKKIDVQAAATDVRAFADDWYERQIRALPDFDRLIGKVYRLRDGQLGDEDRRDLRALLAHFDRARVLTVTRGKPTGSVAINRRMHAAALARATVDQRPDFYPGEPITMRENDYDRGIFNGDQGVVVRVADGDGPHHFRAVFPKPTPAPGQPEATSYRIFHLDALRHQIELGFAMTVHKSQGSEFDTIALVLPPSDLPLLTRELLYTAVTRARRSVEIVGDIELVRRGASKRSRRFSGVGVGLTTT